MTHSLVVSAIALGASLFLLGATKARGLAIGAAVVSGVALTMALGFVRISVPYLDLALAIALAVLGVLLLLRVEAKPKVIAATIIAAIGTQYALALLF